MRRTIQLLTILLLTSAATAFADADRIAISALSRWNGQWLIVNVLWEFQSQNREQFQARSQSHINESKEQ